MDAHANRQREAYVDHLTATGGPVSHLGPVVSAPGAIGSRIRAIVSLAQGIVSRIRAIVSRGRR